VYGPVGHPLALLLVALALAAPGAGGAAAPARAAQEDPDEPPAGLEPTSAQSGPPAAPEGAASGETRPPSRSATTEADGGEPTAPAPRAPAPDAAPDGERRNWMDASHRFVESQLFAPVVRVDRFFSDEAELETERARSFVRWRNELRFDDAGLPSFAVKLRASLRFPGVAQSLRRVRLVLDGETQDALPDGSRPGDLAAEPAGRVRNGDAELRLRLWDGLLAHADVGAGVLFQLPIGAFARFRLRWALPVGDLFLTRLAVIGSYRTDERFGAETDVHLERPIANRVLTRLSTKVRVSEVSPGLEWQTELAAFVALGARAMGAFGAAANGATRREPVPLDTYRVFTRLRADFYRSWLFFELEPEYYWPYTPGKVRAAAWAVTTRLEVQFQGPRRPPDPEEPEPEDPPAHDGAGARDVAPAPWQPGR